MAPRKPAKDAAETETEKTETETEQTEAGETKAETGEVETQPEVTAVDTHAEQQSSQGDPGDENDARAESGRPRFTVMLEDAARAATKSGDHGRHAALTHVLNAMHELKRAIPAALEAGDRDVSDMLRMVLEAL